jgi:hypothetical protein
MTSRIFLMLVGLLLWAPSAATALTISDGGLTDINANYACAVNSCIGNKVLSLESPVLNATGTIDIVDNGGGVGTADLNITLTTFTYVGDVGGVVDEVIFTNVTYAATFNVTFVGNQVMQDGLATSSSVDGFYQQLLGGGEVVANQAFSLAPYFLNFGCALVSGSGQCGVIVGLGVAPPSADYELNVGGTDLEFVNTFNVAVVPEPSTGVLLATALTLLSAATRRRGATSRV